MDEYTQARCCAAENAALLFCLKEQPDTPRDNEHTTRDSNSSLTLSREMQLAEHFAFISSTKDDPNRVTAVCVEADQHRVGITLRVAANTDCLSHTEQELTTIWEIANAHRDKVRAVQGSSSITRSPTVLIGTLSGHCVSSCCCTRRSLPLGPCAR